MIKNRVLTEKMRSKSKKAKKYGLFLKDRIQEMSGYQNMVENKKSIINSKISEEEKNIENSLLKFTNKFNNITARHLRNENQQFLENYKQFSKTNLIKLDSLFQDLSQIYYNKGYKMPNINNNDLYKINPLLEKNPKKIFLSNLSLLSRTKSNKRKKINLNSNKVIRYMNKLERIITPENEEKKIKIKPLNLTQQKLIKKRIKIKEKNKSKNRIVTNSIKNLIKMINNNDLNNLDEQSYSRIRNKSEIIKKDNNIYYNKLYNTNIITDIKTKINKKTIVTNNAYNNLRNYYDSDSSINKISLKNNTINNYKLDRNNNNESDLSYRKNNKTFSSTQKYTMPKINGFDINNKNNNKEKELYLNTERNERKNQKYILKTPKILKQSSSHEKSNNNTKAFSLSIENSSLSNKTKINNSKTKESSINQIKEFTINSYKSKYLNTFNKSIGKKRGHTPSKIIKTEMISKTDKKIPLEFKILYPKKLFKNDEDKENVVNNIYNSFNVGKIKDAEKNIKLYLSKIKKLNDTEINEIFDKYNYQNFKLNIQ